MPVRLVQEPSGADPSPDHLHIGLVNNMPNGALQATERQFLSLLDSAAKGVTVNLSLFALPDLPRSESSRIHIERCYSSLEHLWRNNLDGLIVTGTEPQASDLVDEPYWGSLTKILDWAVDNTHSAVWSCLAAHAAVQHLDGVRRRRLDNRRFGVFECTRAAEHPLTFGLQSCVHVPHSRWNDLPGDQLRDCGYGTLTQLRDGGVDAFVKRRKSLFVFFQGHPEYDRNTLLLEYRRDVGRYLNRERNAYPAMPDGYFDRDLVDLFAAIEKRALSERTPELLADFPDVLGEERSVNTWRPVAAQIYGNWLAYLSDKRREGAKKKVYAATACNAAHSLLAPAEYPKSVTRS